MLTAHQVRTSVVLGAAGATVIAALLLPPASHTTCPPGAALAQSRARLIGAARLRQGRRRASRISSSRSARPIDAHGDIRPPLSLAVVIDRSGSMSGEPLANAKRAAAHRLVDRLDDATRSRSSRTRRRTRSSRRSRARRPTLKRAAHQAIDQIWAHGNTCISCGIDARCIRARAHADRRRARRMVLISDGQANDGIYNRDDLAHLAANTAARGVSISSVGVGLDFDETTMMRLARVGHGNYYFVENTADARRDVRAGAWRAHPDGRRRSAPRRSDEQPGTHVLDAYGYPLLREGSSLVVPVADLRAGEVRKVVLRVAVASEQVASLDSRLAARQRWCVAHQSGDRKGASSSPTPPRRSGRSIARRSRRPRPRTPRACSSRRRARTRRRARPPRRR